MAYMIENIRLWLPGFGTRLLVAAVILIIGIWLSGVVARIMKKFLGKFELDRSIIVFLANTVRITCLVIVAISSISYLGISTTGIIAAFSACAVAIGLALKDSLGNVAGGIMLLFSKAMATGDTIEVDGNIGTVKQIDILHTILNTPDNKQIIIPNGQLINQTIINYSKEERRRLDLVYSISYNADIAEAKAVIMSELKKEDRIITDVPPVIGVLSHGESAVNITVRAWCLSSDYFDVMLTLNERVKLAFDENRIEIPYNKLDVYLKS